MAALQELGGAPELFFDSGDFVEDTSVLGKVTVSLAAAYSTEPLKEYIGWSVVNSDTATAVADGKSGRNSRWHERDEPCGLYLFRWLT